MTKQWHLILPIVCGLTLTACGGGGGSSPTPVDNTGPIVDNVPPTWGHQLRLLPGLTVTEIMTPFTEYDSSYKLELVQPIDHNDPSKGTFLQTAYLHHNDGALPIVMKIAAGSAGNVPTAISTLIGGNQISISHRYFNTAMPETIDWEYLSAEQQAADLHAFYELLKPIYPNQWVGTGYSGGGEAALQYNYHYPDDLDATVVYATGLMNSHADTRLEEYVYNTVSTSECRDRISDFQRLVLSNKTEILSALQLDSELFDMPLGKVLEYGVVEFPYMFWMNDEHDCATIRVEGSEISAIAAYLDKYIWFNGNNRENLLYSAAFYVDIYNEAGYFGFKTDHLADLMNYPNITSMDFTPEEGKRTYDPSKMQDMTDWLTNQGEHIIYVYGGVDPYTQAGIMPIDALESFAAINPDASHEVNISGHPDKDQIHAALASWLGVQVPVNVK